MKALDVCDGAYADLRDALYNNISLECEQGVKSAKGTDSECSVAGCRIASWMPE